MSAKGLPIILVSGEGSTDIGHTDNPSLNVCCWEEWTPGAMAYFIDKIFNAREINVFEWGLMWFVPKKILNAISKKIDPPVLGCSGCTSGKAGFRKNALALLSLAYVISQNEKCDVLPILFRDADQRKWKEMRWQIAHCADKSENIYVCPMIPNPKSEAWLLCALKHNYTSCEKLEDEISGNDKSPNSAKKQLEECLKDYDIHNLNELIENGTIDPLRITMPSMTNFIEDLSKIIYGKEDLAKLPDSLQKKFIENTKNFYPLDNISTSE